MTLHIESIVFNLLSRHLHWFNASFSHHSLHLDDLRFLTMPTASLNSVRVIPLSPFPGGFAVSHLLIPNHALSLGRQSLVMTRFHASSPYIILTLCCHFSLWHLVVIFRFLPPVSSDSPASCSEPSITSLSTVAFAIAFTSPASCSEPSITSLSPCRQSFMMTRFYAFTPPPRQLTFFDYASGIPQIHTHHPYLNLYPFNFRLTLT